MPDQKLVTETLDAIPIERPEPTSEEPQHLCLDKGYAGEPVDRQVRQRGYTPHVPRKANESPKPKHRRGKARRWKVERTHSWLNRARRLLIRWEKKVANYLGLLASSIRHRRVESRQGSRIGFKHCLRECGLDSIT